MPRGILINYTVTRRGYENLLRVPDFGPALLINIHEHFKTTRQKVNQTVALPWV